MHNSRVELRELNWGRSFFSLGFFSDFFGCNDVADEWASKIRVISAVSVDGMKTWTLENEQGCDLGQSLAKAWPSRPG